MTQIEDLERQIKTLKEQEEVLKKQKMKEERLMEFQKKLERKKKISELITILDVKREDDLVYIFTKDVEKDIELFKDDYEKINEDDEDEDILFDISLWCDKPDIIYYELLWQKFPCIRLWFDYEQDTAKEMEDYFLSLKKWETIG